MPSTVKVETLSENGVPAVSHMTYAFYFGRQLQLSVACGLHTKKFAKQTSSLTRRHANLSY